MVSEIQKKINSIIPKIVKLEALQREYEVTLQSWEDLQEKKTKMEIKLANELDDINELDKLSLKSVFHKVLGDKEKQLEKERQEYLQTSLQHRNILKEIEVVEYEKNLLENKLKEIELLRNELEGLKKLREKEILVTNNPLREELLILDGKIDNEIRYINELKEALNAGHNTLEILRGIEAHFEKAVDWGNWDMFSKSSYYKMMKNSEIDQAFNLLPKAKNALSVFSKELYDVGYQNIRQGLSIERINGFLGYIFDNLISDWIVQKKIKGALSAIQNHSTDVQLIIKSLQKDISEREGKIKELNALKDKVLVR